MYIIAGGGGHNKFDTTKRHRLMSPKFVAMAQLVLIRASIPLSVKPALGLLTVQNLRPFGVQILYGIYINAVLWIYSYSQKGKNPTKKRRKQVYFCITAEFTSNL